MDAAAERNTHVRLEALPQKPGQGGARWPKVSQWQEGQRCLVTDADPVDADRGAGEAAGRAGRRGGRWLPSASRPPVRPARGSEISQPFYRVLMGKVFNLLVQAVLLPGIWDTPMRVSSCFGADVAARCVRAA